MALIKINWPKPGEPIGEHFVVFGTARPQVNSINCVLISIAPPHVYLKTGIKPRPTSDPQHKAWSVRFLEGVAPATYRIHVWDPDHPLQAAHVADIEVKNLMSAGGIVYPQHRNIACGDFTSYGTSVAAAGQPVSGTIKNQAGTVLYTAPNSTVDAQGEWALDFTDVQGSNLTITVTIPTDNLNPVTFDIGVGCNPP